MKGKLFTSAIVVVHDMEWWTKEVDVLMVQEQGYETLDYIIISAGKRAGLEHHQIPSWPLR